MNHEPEDDTLPDIAPGSPEELELLLETWGWGTRMPDRLGLCRELIAQGLDLEQLGAVGRLARQKGKEPAALGMTWLTSGTWRDVLADKDLAAKERGLRSRAPSAAEVGPVFGEVKSIGEIPLSSILVGPGSTRTVQPAPEPRAREPEPPPPEQAPIEPRVEPILTPGSAWAKRRARQANANGTTP